MLAYGRGRWAVSQKPKLIRFLRRSGLKIASHADVLRVRHAFLPGAGTRDEPLRTPAWRASLKTGIGFAYFGLESSVVFQKTTGVYERIYGFNST